MQNKFKNPALFWRVSKYIGLVNKCKTHTILCTIKFTAQAQTMSVLVKVENL